MSEIIDLRFATDNTRTEVASFGAILIAAAPAAKVLEKRYADPLTHAHKHFLSSLADGSLPRRYSDQPTSATDQGITNICNMIGLQTSEGRSALHYAFPPIDVHPASKGIFDRYTRLSGSMTEFVIRQCAEKFEAIPLRRGETLRPSLENILKQLRTEYAVWLPTLIKNKTGLLSYDAPSHTEETEIDRPPIS